MSGYLCRPRRNFDVVVRNRGRGGVLVKDRVGGEVLTRQCKSSIRAWRKRRAENTRSIALTK